MGMMRKLPNAGSFIEYEIIKTGRRDVMLKALPGRIRVYAPAWASIRVLDKLVLERREELAAMLASLDEIRAKHDATHPLTDGTEYSLHGESVRLTRCSDKRLSAKYEDNQIVLTAPPDTAEDELRKQLKLLFSSIALKLIRQYIEHYAPLIGVSPSRITVRNQHTRWGSCSCRGNLNFNWKLLLAPPEAMEYVVVHELCHLKEFSHSPKFWSLVSQHFPEYTFWKGWLKQHGRELGV